MNPALISLRITAVIYFLIAASVLALSFAGENSIVLIFMALFTAVLGYGLLRIRRGLLEGKYWAWVAGIIVSGMLALSLFFPLGIMGLIGLLNQPTRRAFNSLDR